VSEVAPQGGIIGLELHRLVENPHRIVAPPQVEQRSAERRQISRLGIVPERAGRPFHRMVELPCIEADEPHQVQNLGVVGASLEQLAAKHLRFEKFSRTHFAEHGIQDRGEVIRRGLGRIKFALLGSHRVLSVH
jgi:hypothetical protein